MSIPLGIPRLHPQVGHWTRRNRKMDCHRTRFSIEYLNQRCTSGITNQCLCKYDSGREKANGLDPFNIPFTTSSQVLTDWVTFRQKDNAAPVRWTALVWDDVARTMVTKQHRQHHCKLRRKLFTRTK